MKISSIYEKGENSKMNWHKFNFLSVLPVLSATFLTPRSILFIYFFPEVFYLFIFSQKYFKGNLNLVSYPP